MMMSPRSTPKCPATPVASLNDGPYQLDVDQNGLIYYGSFGSGLYTINPGTGAVSQLNPLQQLNAMTIDRVSG